MIALAVIIGVQAVALLVFSLRQSTLKDEATEAEHRRISADKQLAETSRELVEYKVRGRAQLRALREDIEKLEADLEICTTPGARRTRLERLLSKTEDRSHDDNRP